MIDLGERRHRALVSAAAGALLDGHRGRDAENGVDVGARRGLHELPRVGVQGLEIAALTLGKQNIECQRALAAARNAGNDRELVEPQVHIDVLEVVLAGAANLDGDGPGCGALHAFAWRRRAPRRAPPNRPCSSSMSARPVCEAARSHDLGGRADRRRCAAGLAALGTQVDDPVGGADHIEIVLDDEQRVPSIDEASKRPQQFGDIVEMQARGRLVEQEQGAAARAVIAGARARFLGRLRAHGAVRQMPGELQALRLASGEGGDRLTEAQIVESDFGEGRQPQANFRVRGKKRQRFGDGQIQHIGDALGREFAARQFDVEHIGPVAPAVAIGTAQIHVRQELHFDVLEAIAAACRAAAVTGIETERAGGVLALAGLRQAARTSRGWHRTRRRSSPDSSAWCGRCGSDPPLPHRRSTLRPARRGAARVFRGFALGAQQRRKQDVVHQRGFARAADAGDADQAPERNLDVDVLEIVLGGALEPQRRRRSRRARAPAAESRRACGRNR